MASIVTTTITNGAGQNLVLRLSNDGNPPPTIKNTQTATFPLAVPANYVNGALVYEVGNSLKWILFWTTDNQVSTKMFKISDSIDWKQVANNLKSGQMSEDMITYAKYEYTAWANIGPNSYGQAVTASINARPVSK
ncbi:ATPase synthesis 25, mitochondrial [Gossypium arboreum]|uniref:ATPase synthesis 25, mitochondrial n=1 Tax=Gossypium arboreum TaxID=29729 RepID=A0A0B0MDQ1_GOSAR|nr:ATPase synthesis 25, mitochondrial [Gossypium arboreum]KHF98630.1 ATPase synthesis 25, mitochondrial [Gossypium arboreum]KHG08021.1 ATPase synthesis 25, mitochondrial [Gossypium arboreum]KHG23218.1 ATPase synthesis 25, mitochondrial [Gossypium arboreum]